MSKNFKVKKALTMFLTAMTVFSNVTPIHAEEPEIEGTETEVPVEIEESKENEGSIEEQDNTVEVKEAEEKPEEAVEAKAEKAEEVKPEAEAEEVKPAEVQPQEAPELNQVIVAADSAAEFAGAVSQMSEDPENRLVVLGGDDVIGSIADLEYSAVNFEEITVVEFTSKDDKAAAADAISSEANAADVSNEVVFHIDTNEEGEEKQASQPEVVSGAEVALPVSGLRARADAEGKKVIAIIDTGVGNGLADESVDLTGFGAEDGHGHGTQMASIIRTIAGNDVLILSIKAFDNSGASTSSLMTAAVLYAIESGVDYINISASANDSQDATAFKEAIAKAVNSGITVVGSAGNGDGDAAYRIPANIDGVIGVTSVEVTPEEVRITGHQGRYVDYGVVAYSTSEATAALTAYMASETMDAQMNKFVYMITSDGVVKPEPVDEESQWEADCNDFFYGDAYYWEVPIGDTNTNNATLIPGYQQETFTSVEQKKNGYEVINRACNYDDDFERGNGNWDHDDKVAFTTGHGYATFTTTHRFCSTSRYMGEDSDGDDYYWNGYEYSITRKTIPSYKYLGYNLIQKQGGGNTPIAIPAHVNVNLSQLKTGTTVKVELGEGGMVTDHDKGLAQGAPSSPDGSPARKSGFRLNFYYQLDKVPLTIRYLEKGTDKVLATQYGPQLTTPGTTYNVKSAVVDGYHLVDENQQVVTGKMPNKETVLTVYYEKDPNLTIHYLEKGTDKVLAPQYGPASKKPGTPYDIPSAEVPKYHLVDSKQAHVTGTMPSTNVVIDVYYEKDPTLKINYLEKDTDKVLATPYGPEYKKAGETYSIGSPIITGYHLVVSTEDIIAGTMPAKDTEIDVYYEQDPKLTVMYLEKDTEKVLAPQYGPQTKKAGAKYSVPSPDVDMYHLVDDSQAVVSGAMPATDLVIKVYYEYDFKLTIKYLDKEDDHPVDEPFGPKGMKQGKEYEVPSPDVPDYIIDKDEQKIITGVMPAHDVEVIVYYVKIPAPVKNVYNLKGENIDGKYVNDGEEYQYVITAHNPSSVEKEYTITDVLPDYTEFVSADNDGEFKLGAVKWTVNVPAGQDVKVSFNVKANGRNAVINNTADVTVDEKTKPTNTTHNATPDNVKVVKVNGKDVEGEYLPVGTEVTYDITVENKFDTEKVYEVFDDIPECTEFVSADSDGEFEDGTVSWEVKLGPKEEKTVRMIVRITENNAVISNQAKACVDNACAFTNYPVTILTPPEPVKDVVDASGVSINHKAVNVGDELIYKIAVKNTAKVEKEITVTDEIPEDTEFVEIYDNGTFAEGLCTWTVMAQPESEFTVSFKVKVLESAFGKIVKNKAYVKFDDAVIETNEVENPVQPGPVKDILNEKGESIDGKMLANGQKAKYTIFVENPSDEERTYEVIDELDSHVKALAASDEGKIEGQKVSWTLKIPAHSDHTFTIDVEIVGDNAYIPNEAIMKVEGLEIASNKTENWTPGVEKAVKDAEGKDINKEYIAKGDTITYEIKVSNPSDTEREFIVTDQIPADLKVVEISDGGSQLEQKVTWTFKLEAKGSKTLKVKAEATADGSKLENEAIVRVDDVEVKSNKVVNWTPKQPVKAVKDSAGKDINGMIVGVNSELHYEITVENTAEAEKEFKVTDKIPADTSFVSADNGGKESTGVVTWTFKLAAGEKKVLKFVVKATKEESYLPNTAKQIVDDIEVESNKVENWTMKTPVKAVVDKDGKDINKKMVFVGDTITYKITFKNPTAAKQRVYISDKLPEHLEFVSAQNGGKLSDGVVNWTIDLEADQEFTVSFNAKVKAEAAGKTIKNKAEVRFGEGPKVPTNEVENPVQPNPEKSVVDNAGNDMNGKTVNNNTPLTFKIKIKNPSDEDKVYTITDKLPTNLADIKPSNGGTVANNVITWKITVKAGAEAMVSFTANIKGYKITIKNIAEAEVDGRKLTSNEVTVSTNQQNVTPADKKESNARQTGVEGSLLGYELAAAAALAVMALILIMRRKRAKA